MSGGYTMQFLSKNNIIMIALSISAAVIFAVDLFIPMGLIIWLGYIPLIFLSLFLKDRKFVKLLGYAISIFIIVAFVFDVSVSKGLVPWQLSLYHRFFGVLLIAIITFISLKLIETRTRIDRLEKLIKVCAWSKKIKVEDEWLTIEEFMKRYLGKDVTHGISPEAYDKMFTETKVSDDSKRK